MTANESIEIEVHPVKRIVVFDCIEVPIEEFFGKMELIARAAATAGQPMMLNWAEGIIFFLSPYQPESEVIIEEMLRGTMYLASVMFASMPLYQPIKKFGSFEVPIVDQTSVPNMKQLAQWLKIRINLQRAK